LRHAFPLGDKGSFTGVLDAVGERPVEEFETLRGTATDAARRAGVHSPNDNVVTPALGDTAAIYTRDDAPAEP
jgi:hypothetical protein